MSIRTCIFCDAVHDADDFDEDWDTSGCPECDNKTIEDDHSEYLEYKREIMEMDEQSAAREAEKLQD